MNKQEALFTYLLRLGDNALIQGHRLSEWCSRGPILEEDLALTNIALDHIGRAQALLQYAAEVEGDGKTADDLAYKRGERNFYNNLLTELPIGDFAYTVAKQWLLSSFEFSLYNALCHSKDQTLAAISAKTVKELRYHMTHARDWCYRLGKGTTLSHEKLQNAFQEVWMYTGELFEMDEVDACLIEAGIATDLQALYADWQTLVQKVLYESTLPIPAADYRQTGSRQGIHTEYLGHILSEMQYLQRAYPDAQW
jgi:ring-1,2-phenylacetyl-CoA epoxidase subunit PaaC